MPSRIVLEGQQFGRLLVVRPVRVLGAAHLHYECLCDCGHEIVVSGPHIRTGHTRSCGCLQLEVTLKRSLQHALTNTKCHRAWVGMRKRCENATGQDYENYQKRGIKVCERWQRFELFYEDMGLPENGQTLERVDNNGNYEPENCRWASRKVQANNRRSNVLLTYRGRTQNMTQWAEEIGVRPVTLRNRLVNLGWSLERALMKV